MENTVTIGNMILKRINIRESYDVDAWAKRFKVTSTQLKRAVKAVGMSSINVAIYLDNLFGKMK